jgi:hypothetical protein
MSRHKPFLFIALLLSIASSPVLSWAQVTTLPAVAGTVVQQGAPAAAPVRAKASSPAGASDLPLLALLGFGLLLTGAGMVTSIRPSRQRA